MNGIFGFVESFRATYFCRRCESSITECQTQVKVNDEKIRKESTYLALLNNIDPKKEVYIESKGLKKFCIFNQLAVFSIFDNFSIDVMHDLNEGVISFFLVQFFKYLENNTSLTLSAIQTNVRDYPYGRLWTKYKPSPFTIDKDTKKLNQNAMQTYCLMVHLPFIFFAFKTNIPCMWKAMENLLSTMQIVYSNTIRETDIIRLEKHIESHLSFIVTKLKLDLLPKHHFLLHYANFIRASGPPIHSWMMRYESKHKFLNDISKRSSNFNHLSKTLVTRHQMFLCVNVQSFEPNIVPSKTLYDVTKSKNYSKYSTHLQRFFVGENLLSLNFLLYESFEYRPGFFVIHENNVFEILHIFEENEKYIFFCSCYSKKFDTSLNSIEIELIVDSYTIIDLKSIKYKKSYDRQSIANHMSLRTHLKHTITLINCL